MPLGIGFMGNLSASRLEAAAFVEVTNASRHWVHGELIDAIQTLFAEYNVTNASRHWVHGELTSIEAAAITLKASQMPLGIGFMGNSKDILIGNPT